ncbi:hypothetical protein D3C80_1213380 [compost metagenome]
MLGIDAGKILTPTKRYAQITCFDLMLHIDASLILLLQEARCGRKPGNRFVVSRVEEILRRATRRSRVVVQPLPLLIYAKKQGMRQRASIETGFQLRVECNCIKFWLREIIGARNGVAIPSTRRQNACKQISIIGFHVRIAEILTQREGVVEAMFKRISYVANFLFIDSVAWITIREIT